jgi:hypothetical protein
MNDTFPAKKMKREKIAVMGKEKLLVKLATTTMTGPTPI